MFRTPYFQRFLEMFRTPKIDVRKCFIPRSGNPENVSYPGQKHSGRVCRLNNEQPLNGTMSDWKSISAGVPQGSVLGPLLFLVYINDLTENIKSEMRLFADDSSLFTPVKGVTDTHEQLVKDL